MHAAATTQIIFAAVEAMSRAEEGEFWCLDLIYPIRDKLWDALFLKFSVTTPPMTSATIWVMSPTLLSTVVLVAVGYRFTGAPVQPGRVRTREAHVLAEQDNPISLDQEETETYIIIEEKLLGVIDLKFHQLWNNGEYVPDNAVGNGRCKDRGKQNPDLDILDCPGHHQFW